MSAEEKAPEAAAPVDATAQRAVAAEEEARQLYDQLIRLKAEFENYRKRVDREKPELVRHGRTELIEKLLPLYDVLTSAHQQVSQGLSSTELVQGLELIFKEFAKLFEGEGVAAIDCVGHPLDYEKHEVMGQVETDDEREGVVVEEIQRGYLLNGRTLRPARVRVATPKKG